MPDTRGIPGAVYKWHLLKSRDFGSPPPFQYHIHTTSLQEGRVKPKTLSTSQEFLHLFFLCSLVRVCIWWLEAWIFFIGSLGQTRIKKGTKSNIFPLSQVAFLPVSVHWSSVLPATLGPLRLRGQRWKGSTDDQSTGSCQLALCKQSFKNTAVTKISPSKTSSDKKPFQWILVLACESQMSGSSLVWHNPYFSERTEVNK